MDIPGQSLFQGGGSLELNNSAQKRQEQEELLDQLRLQNEESVGLQLQNAFDDISDGDETIESSVFNSIHSQNGSLGDRRSRPAHNAETKIPHNYKDARHRPYGNEIESIRNALESKSMECKHLTNCIQEDKKKYDDHINELQKRLAIAESEKERSHMSRQQTHESLVKCKGTISELENSIEKNMARIKDLENRNLELLTDLDLKKTMIGDLQLKYQMIERNVGLSNGRHDDLLLKQSHERYAGQIDMLQQQIDGLRNQLEEKEMELKRSDANFKELQRSREAMLVEKSDTINQLSKTIEDSQRQCQQLMSKGDMLQENMLLKNTINSLSRKDAEMQKTMYNLNKSFDEIYSELKHIFEMLNPDLDLSQDRNTNFPDMDISFYITTVLTRLTSELNRSMIARNAHDIALRKLENELADKNTEIKKLKDDENSALVQMMNYKEESHRLSNRLKVLQSETDRMENVTRAHTRCEDQQHQIDIEEMEDKLKNLHKQYGDLTQENTNLRQEMKNKDVARDEERIDTELKKRSCSKCVDKMSELATIEISNLELQNECANHVKVITDLKSTINELKSKQVENERHLVELQHGARKFEEFMKNQNDNETKLSPSKQSTAIDRQDELKMAKILATKIKAVEMKFQEQIDLSVRNMEFLKSEINDARQLIIVKTNEVQLLKQAILSERSKMADFLSQREEETNILFERNNKLFKECQNKLHISQNDLAFLQREHNYCAANIADAQRSITDLQNEKQYLQQREANLEIRNAKMDKEMSLNTEQWSVKYNAAKKTAAHYKKYAEAKDKYIEEENLRVKSAYEAAIRKMQSKFQMANNKD